MRATGAEDKAREAAKAVAPVEGLATKADLHELEARLTRTILTAMVSMTAIFAVIVKLP